MKSFQGTLLVVDDFELNRDMLSRRLKSRGYRVHTAANGVEALQKVAEVRTLDLVLLDIMMPDLDGFEILERIREDYSSTELAVIMVTAKDQSEDIVRALALGADDYVTKPVDFPVALARIKSQLKRRDAESALKESEERYALAARGANDGLWDWDLRTDQVYYSDRWKQMIGFEPDEVGPSIDEWFNRVHPDDMIRLRKEMDRHLAGAIPTLMCEYRMMIKDHGYRWLLTRATAVADHKGVRCRMVGWQTDANDRVAHDSLTSLPNRGLFNDRITWAIQRVTRNTDDNYAVFYLGIDRFKVVNESMGHERGDQMLNLLARRIEKLLRPQDTLARMGGDEFGILLEQVESVGSATQIVERIMSSMEEPFEMDSQEVHITVSIGIALGQSEIKDPSEIVRMANNAMISAKSRGKNCYDLYREGLDANTVSSLEMENHLRKALERDEIFLVYQPQIETATGEIIGVEALVRWNSKELGFISPGVFIPLAEETGLIFSIGTWVLRTACVQNKAWQDMGLPPIRMAVNVSSRQFSKARDLLGIVKETLEQTGLDSKWLDLELTETLLMENDDQTRADLDKFHQLGIQISLDDFGTGYSSLSRLKRFPIDTLKIDQSFVRDLTTESDDAAICTAIIAMAHSMKMRVIAEGVETAEHETFLKDIKCDEMQGYYFSKPTSAEEIAKMLSR